MALPIILGGLAARTLPSLISRGALAAGAGVGISQLLDRDGRPMGRRRRRRRALTQGDRQDIAFITATLGKAAADRFASQIVAGNRG